jgi:hypothetical protein
VRPRQPETRSGLNLRHEAVLHTLALTHSPTHSLSHLRHEAVVAAVLTPARVSDQPALVADVALELVWFEV